MLRWAFRFISKACLILCEIIWLSLSSFVLLRSSHRSVSQGSLRRRGITQAVRWHLVSSAVCIYIGEYVPFGLIILRCIFFSISFEIWPEIDFLSLNQRPLSC